MSSQIMRFHLPALCEPDEKLDISQLDREIVQLRVRLVRRRYFSCLRLALEKVPEIEEMRFAPGSVKDFVGPVNHSKEFGLVIRGKLKARTDEEVSWVKFDKLLRSARKSIGPSNETLEALQSCLPQGARSWGSGRFATVDLTRRQVLLFCQAICECDSIKLDRTTLHAMELEEQVKGPGETPSFKRRM